MTLAVDGAVLVAVGQVHQLLLALRAHEAGRVPAQVFVHLGRVDGHLAHVDVAVTAVAALKQLRQVSIKVHMHATITPTTHNISE